MSNVHFFKAEEDSSLDVTVLSGPHWETDVRQRTYTWMARAKTWICSAEQLTVVHYENLRNDLKRGIVTMLDFIEVERDQQRLDCATNHGVNCP